MLRHWLLILLLLPLACHARRQAPSTPRMDEPISVTLSRGDFVVVGRQQEGLAIYLTIDRREKSCLVEVQNTTNDPIDVLDCWSAGSSHHRLGFSAGTVARQPHVPASAPAATTMTRLFPSQIISGLLPLHVSEDGPFSVQLRVWHRDPMLTKWIDVESPEMTVVR